jgi:hypothetical protein
MNIFGALLFVGGVIVYIGIKVQIRLVNRINDINMQMVRSLIGTIDVRDESFGALSLAKEKNNPL